MRGRKVKNELKGNLVYPRAGINPGAKEEAKHIPAQAQFQGCVENGLVSLPAVGRGTQGSMRMSTKLKTISQGGVAASPVLGSATQSWAGSSRGGCRRTVASLPGAVCSWPQSHPAQAVVLLGPGEQDPGVKALSAGGRVQMYGWGWGQLVPRQRGPCCNGPLVHPFLLPLAAPTAPFSPSTWWSLASTGPVFSFSSYFSTLACSLL